MQSERNLDDEQSSDRALVAFRPPVMLGILLLLGFGLRFIDPLKFVSDRAAVITGTFVTVAAWSLFFWAVLTMRRHGASVPTNQPTDAIVSAGPYMFSRNPIYLAMVLLLTGVAFLSNSLWFMACAAVDVGLLTWGVISREEKYLEDKFGSAYTSYKERVRRWI